MMREGFYEMELKGNGIRCYMIVRMLDIRPSNRSWQQGGKDSSHKEKRKERKEKGEGFLPAALLHGPAVCGTRTHSHSCRPLRRSSKLFACYKREGGRDVGTEVWK